MVFDETNKKGRLVSVSLFAYLSAFTGQQWSPDYAKRIGEDYGQWGGIAIFGGGAMWISLASVDSFNRGALNAVADGGLFLLPDALRNIRKNGGNVYFIYPAFTFQ